MKKEILSHVKTFEGIFNDYDIITIPLYQRDYQWGKEHAGILIRDILEHDYNQSDYYMGNVLLSHENDNLLLVDGQQRITTILLILIFIHNNIEPISDEKNVISHVESLKNKIKKMITNSNGKIVLDKSEFDRNDHVDIFERILKNKDLSGAKNSKIVSGYDNISKNKDLKNLLENFTWVNDFVDKITQKTNFILIIVPDEMGANNIFININTKGKNLDEIDKIRSYIHSIIGKDFNKQEWGYLYDELINKYEMDFDYYIQIFIVKHFQEEYEDAIKKNIGVTKIKYHVISQITDKDKLLKFNKDIVSEKNIQRYISIIEAKIPANLYSGSHRSTIISTNRYINAISEMNYKQIKFLLYLILFDLFDNERWLKSYKKKDPEIVKMLKNILSLTLFLSISKEIPNVLKSDFYRVETDIFKDKQGIMNWSNKIKEHIDKLSNKTIDAFKENVKELTFKEAGKSKTFFKIILSLASGDFENKNTLYIEHIISKNEAKLCNLDEPIRNKMGGLVLVKKDDYKDNKVVDKKSLYKKNISKECNSLKCLVEDNNFIELESDKKSFANFIDRRSDDIVNLFLEEVGISEKEDN